MADKHYHFNVKMACQGCSGAVTKVLNKLNGVKSIDISLENQSVDVITSDSVSYEDVYQTIYKTGKEIHGGNVMA